ncbi:TonB family protein [Mucilaginibacter corticis]|uniref:TonB family protein n=1 Tax=Mucilaginibacter corticis TaxID=2597670 RepID=A0A556MVM8_9SPHI|nr:energy transducer TonB [Mucilaginibacter corticis]TSJ43915.1 TonB family protein [Mucilaginibacter corticis]
MNLSNKQKASPCLFILIPLFALAVSPGKAKNITRPLTDTTHAKIFSVVEKQPQFPGGMQEFGRFLGSTIHYPKIDRDNKVGGRVIVTFVVEQDGSLSNIKAVRGPSETLMQAAVDALSQSPKWEPGYQNGRTVRVAYTVPVSFTLPNQEPAAPGATQQPADKVFGRIGDQPMFPGGFDEFGKYLTKAIRYPKADHDAGIAGRVICTFVVEKDGSLTDIKAVRGPSETLNDEAVRVLAASPKWVPGKTADGQPARVAYTVPINFQLDGKGNAPMGGKPILPTTSIDTILMKLHAAPNSPLFVVDGVEYGMDKPLPDLKKENLASMEVLKNEAATKLYGDKGKNGVILIKTKHPESTSGAKP